MAAAARSTLRLLPRSTLRSLAIRPAILSASQLHTSSPVARPAGKGDQGL